MRPRAHLLSLGMALCSPSCLHTRIYMPLQTLELAVSLPFAIYLLTVCMVCKLILGAATALLFQVGGFPAKWLNLNSNCDTADNSSRSLFEMQQLLDVHRYFVTDTTNKSFGDSINKEYNIPSIAERFMGMKAALITTSEPIANLGKSLGFTISNGKVKLSFAESSTCNTAPQLPTSASVASQLIELLGLRAPSLNNSNSFELVLLHIGGGAKDENSGGYLDWIDSLVGEIKTLMEPGTEAYDHLYLSLALGYGNEAVQASTNKSECLCLEPLDCLPPNLRALRPQQTYKMKDGKPVDGVRDHHPLLVVHQMDGVTRRDFSASFSFQEFQKNGCNLTILADRFLHEIAFKLWKAPKYGA